MKLAVLIFVIKVLTNNKLYDYIKERYAKNSSRHCRTIHTETLPLNIQLNIKDLIYCKGMGQVQGFVLPTNQKASDFFDLKRKVASFIMELELKMSWVNTEHVNMRIMYLTDTSHELKFFVLRAITNNSSKSGTSYDKWNLKVKRKNAGLNLTVPYLAHIGRCFFCLPSDLALYANWSY